MCLSSRHAVFTRVTPVQKYVYPFVFASSHFSLRENVLFHHYYRLHDVKPTNYAIRKETIWSIWSIVNRIVFSREVFRLSADRRTFSFHNDEFFRFINSRKTLWFFSQGQFNLVFKSIKNRYSFHKRFLRKKLKIYSKRTRVKNVIKLKEEYRKFRESFSSNIDYCWFAHSSTNLHLIFA